MFLFPSKVQKKYTKTYTSWIVLKCWRIKHGTRDIEHMDILISRAPRRRPYLPFLWQILRPSATAPRKCWLETSSKKAPCFFQAGELWIWLPSQGPSFLVAWWNFWVECGSPPKERPRIGSDGSWDNFLSSIFTLFHRCKRIMLAIKTIGYSWQLERSKSPDHTSFSNGVEISNMYSQDG